MIKIRNHCVSMYWWSWFLKDPPPLHSSTNTNWFDALDQGYPHSQLNLVLASALESTAQFKNFCNLYFTPPSSYGAQRKTISDFSWFERLRTMFTTTDEADMNPKTSLSSFCDLRDSEWFYGAGPLWITQLVSFYQFYLCVQAGKCSYGVRKWSGDLSHINH